MTTDNCARDKYLKWYINKPESILEDETHQILWDFKIQMDHKVQVKRPGLILIKKKKITCQLEDFSDPLKRRLEMKGG